jgi:hypothetical protein
VQTSDNAKKILYSVFTNECDAVGPTLVDKIVSGEPISSPEEGRRMDLTSVLELLAAAVALINEMLELKKILKKANNRNPTKNELLSAIKEKYLPEESPINQYLDKIIDDIIKNNY